MNDQRTCRKTFSKKLCCTRLQSGSLDHPVNKSNQRISNQFCDFPPSDTPAQIHPSPTRSLCCCTPGLPLYDSQEIAASALQHSALQDQKLRLLIFALLLCVTSLLQPHAHAQSSSPSDSHTWLADNGNGTFSNPLFFDEFSDPDLIRVGADFYLTGTTMHAMPGLAVLHSLDLVNWDFESYASPRLDLGPAFRLEDGQNIYGQGIWAPSFRYHDGTFYIFSNVNGRSTQLFRSQSPKGPWTHTSMKHGFHDLSVLFDDDGKAYVVWGYRDIHLAQLNADFTDIVPGSEHIIIDKSQGMGEGLHLYKIHGKYFLTSAWYMGVMRMPVARADSLNGPWEVNRDVSAGEQFGLELGYRLNAFRPPLSTPRPYVELPPDPNSDGRMAMHQGGLVETPTGEWWGFSMFEANALGRLTALSPITWKDGWPYFGLPGNLGRSPRTWIKPNTGATETPHAPYVRSDDFSGPTLHPLWQWNHVPVDAKWSLSERPGYLRLHALPATSLWDARNTLTQRAIGPISIPTVALDASGLQPGDVAGFALLVQPEAWIGVRKQPSGFELIQHNGETGRDEPATLPTSAVLLRATCDFNTQLATFSYSTDGKNFHNIGEPFRMVTAGITFQGVRYSLFNFNTSNQNGGYADFDYFHLTQPEPHANTRPIPYGQQILLHPHTSPPDPTSQTPSATENSPIPLTIIDRGLGRVALRSAAGFFSVAPDGAISLRPNAETNAETFQWIETFTGELTLLSLQTNRYLRVTETRGILRADSPGPEPDGKEKNRFDWSIIGPKP
jgi:xylan 1,4-beta-xylosidase